MCRRSSGKDFVLSCHKSEIEGNGFARRCGAVFCMGGGGLVWKFRQVGGRVAGDILQVDLTRLEVTGEVLKGLDQDTDGEVNDVKGGVVRVNEQSDERKEVI